MVAQVHVRLAVRGHHRNHRLGHVGHDQLNGFRDSHLRRVGNRHQAAVLACPTVIGNLAAGQRDQVVHGLRLFDRRYCDHGRVRVRQPLVVGDAKRGHILTGLPVGVRDACRRRGGIVGPVTLEVPFIQHDLAVRVRRPAGVQCDALTDGCLVRPARFGFRRKILVDHGQCRLCVGRAGGLLNVSDIIHGDAVKRVRVAVLTREHGRWGRDVVQPKHIVAAIRGDVNIITGDARTPRIILAGPRHEEVFRGGCPRKRQHRALRPGCVDRDETFLRRIGALSGVVRVDLVGGDDLAEVEDNDRDVADIGARGQRGLGLDDIAEVAHSAAGPVLRRQEAC